MFGFNYMHIFKNNINSCCFKCLYMMICHWTRDSRRAKLKFDIILRHLTEIQVQLREKIDIPGQHFRKSQSFKSHQSYDSCNHNCKYSLNKASRKNNLKQTHFSEHWEYFFSSEIFRSRLHGAKMVCKSCYLL